MGNFLSNLWGKFFNTKKEFKMLILGLANAGKTTLLYQLHLGQVIQTQPTIGSNVEEITHKNLKLQAWDLGGQESIRQIWSSYFTGTDAVIFVIDSTDKKTELLSKAELYNLLCNDVLKDCVFLVFANKQDLDEAMSEEEIIAHLNLDSIKEHNWHIQKCSALKGEGIEEGLDWIYEKLMEKSK